MVAWDGKRASARVIGDAMSMLEEKGKVTILTIGNTVPSGTNRLIQNLTRHGINAEHMQHLASGSIGATILDITQTIGADLIVMGGTFSSLPTRYQNHFIKECFRAANDFPKNKPARKKSSLKHEKKRNEI